MKPLLSHWTRELIPMVFPILRLLASCWMAPAMSLVPMAADGRLWDFSAYIIVWTNSCNITPHISIYTPQVLFLRKTIIQSQNSLSLPTGPSFLSIVLKKQLCWPALLSFSDLRLLGKESPSPLDPGKSLCLLTYSSIPHSLWLTAIIFWWWKISY